MLSHHSSLLHIIDPGFRYLSKLCCESMADSKFRVPPGLHPGWTSTLSPFFHPGSLVLSVGRTVQSREVILLHPDRSKR